MHPILIDFGVVDLPLLGPTHLFLPTYGVLFAGGRGPGLVVVPASRATLGLPEERLFNLTFYQPARGDPRREGDCSCSSIGDVYWARPAEILGTIRSAGVLIGGVAAGSATFALYARRHALPLWSLADAIAAPLALAQAFGRLGCFAAGCCWGIPVDAGQPLAVVFT